MKVMENTSVEKKTAPGSVRITRALKLFSKEIINVPMDAGVLDVLTT